MSADRGWVASMLSAVILMISCTLMPRAIGALAPFIVADLRLSAAQLGALVSSVFLVSALAAITSAHVVDRVNSSLLMRGLLVLVVVDVVLVVTAGGYRWLVLVVGLAGISQGLANPVANRIVSAGVPPARQPVAIGLKQSAVQMGTALAALVLPTLAVGLGWQRSMLALLGLPAVALGVSATERGTRRKPLPVAQSPPPSSTPPERARRTASAASWRLAAYSFFIATGVSGVSTYLTLYLHDRLSYSASAAGVVLGLVGVVAVLGRIGWAQVAGSRPESGRVAAMIAAGGAVSAVLIALASTGAIWLAWVGALGVGATTMAANAVSNLSVVRRNGSGRTGHSSAIVAFGFFCGFIPGPVLFGLAVESPVGYNGAWSVVVVQFAIAGWISFRDRGGTGVAVVD